MRICQAIETKYIGPTNLRGSRVKATAQAGSIIMHWDDALGVDENHTKAALALCAKYDWKGKLCAGALSNGRGNVFVFVDNNEVVEVK